MSSPDRLACVDIGSTWTKAALVDAGTGELLATRQAPTSTDVVPGVLAATEGWDAGVLACSSAGAGCGWRWSATSS